MTITLTSEELVDELWSISQSIEHHNAQLSLLYAQRLALFKDARSRTPAIRHEKMAQACGVSEVAIIAALRKEAGVEHANHVEPVAWCALCAQERREVAKGVEAAARRRRDRVKKRAARAADGLNQTG